VTLSTNFTATGHIAGYTDTGFGYGINGDTVASKVTNNTGSDRYATFAVYRAPGGGSGPSENLRSQKLIYSETHLIPAGQFYVFMKDISALDQTGPGVNGDHLTGDDDFQCDDFDAGCDPHGYAPDKLNDGTSLDGHIFAGELFNYSDTDQNDGHGKKK